MLEMLKENEFKKMYRAPRDKLNKIRNPNIEIRNKLRDKSQIGKILKRRIRRKLVWRFTKFENCFEFRISCFEFLFLAFRRDYLYWSCL